MGRLRIRKTDSESGGPLEGVEFTLYEKESGEEAAVLVTDKDGNAESELLPIGKYEDGAFLEGIVYLLKETRAKEGYQTSEEEWEIRFEYQDGRTPVVEVLQEITNTKQADAGTSRKAPQTGDRLHWVLPLLGIPAGSTMLLMAAQIRRKRRRRQRRNSRREHR